MHLHDLHRCMNAVAWAEIKPVFDYSHSSYFGKSRESHQVFATALDAQQSL